MKTKNKNTVYINTEVESTIKREVPIIIQQIKTNAVDLARKQLPKQNDPLRLYIPIVWSLFQSLLENVHSYIGAKRTFADKQSIEENYTKEEALLTSKVELRDEDLRVLKKQEQSLDNNLGHVIRNWYMALLGLGALSFSETLLNYKIFLPISSNRATALVGATGISIAFFIICHVFPDVIKYFKKRITKILSGFIIISLVTALLWSFAKLRLSFATRAETISAEHISEWNFVILNLTLFFAGLALTLRYKPNKDQFTDYNKHKGIGDQIKALTKESKSAEQRLEVLHREKNEELGKLDGIQLMAYHYEKIISAEYHKGYAIWCDENRISRKDKVHPEAFLEDPKPLKTYFDNVEFQTHSVNLKD